VTSGAAYDPSLWDEHMAEAAVGSSTREFLFLGEAVALCVAVGFPPEAAKSMLLTGVRTFNIGIRCLELVGHLHPLDLQPHMASFWNIHDPHVTLQIDWETSEVRRSVAPGVVQSASFLEWCWSGDAEKIRQRKQEYTRLRKEIIAAHQAGQLPQSSCVVSGVQIRRVDVEELLRRCGRPQGSASSKATAKVLTRPETPEEWLEGAVVDNQLRQRDDETATRYAARLVPHMHAKLGERAWPEKTLLKRLYDSPTWRALRGLPKLP
jgi:hypothetical protein